GRPAFADLGLPACLLPLSDRELPLQHVNDLPMKRAMLMCCELLEALVERERHPQGDLLEIASWGLPHTSLIGHRSTVPARCCLAESPIRIGRVSELSCLPGTRVCICVALRVASSRVL